MKPGTAVAIRGVGGPTPPSGTGPTATTSGLGSSDDIGLGGYIALACAVLTNRSVLAVIAASAVFFYVRHIHLLGFSPVLATLLLILGICVMRFTRISLEGRPAAEQRKRHTSAPRSAAPTVVALVPAPVTVTAIASDLPRGELTAQRVEEYIVDAEIVTENREVA